ncbi:hypothetical protein [Ruegeria sp. SCP10]
MLTQPDTGRRLADHRDRALWMGEVLSFDLLQRPCLIT